MSDVLRCFHCDKATPPTAAFRQEVSGETRSFCCTGCAAANRFITEHGLNAYYQRRSGPTAPVGDGTSEGWDTWDRQAVLDSVAPEEQDGAREVQLSLENVQCAACAWLIERSTTPLEGVVDAQVSLATGRLRLRWKQNEIPLSRALAHLAGLGYRPRPPDSTAARAGRVRERRKALQRLGVAGLGMMQVMMYAVAMYLGEHQDMSPEFRSFFAWVSLLIATPVVAFAGRPFFNNALRDLRARRPGMDVPVALAIGGAYCASLYNTITGGEIYFDSVIMFIFFLSIGRFFELNARQRSADVAEALAEGLPSLAHRWNGDRLEQVGVVELRPGDRVSVARGDALPGDGRLRNATARLDESLLSGESETVVRRQGETVLAGSINTGDPVDVELTHTGSKTRLAGISRLMNRALTERPGVARVADAVARWFVGGVLLLSALVYAAWLQIDPSRAFEITLAVLVVTCPCALSLATPTVLTVACGRLARLGLLVTRSDALETLAGLDRLVFDKTGTLTLGRPAVTQMTTYRGDAETAARIAAGLEACSSHPIAHAFARSDAEPAEQLSEHPGAGVAGKVDGVGYRLGRPAFAAALYGGEPPEAEGVLLATTEGPVALFRLADSLRPEAPAAIRALRDLGVESTILSGDQTAAVTRAAADLAVEDWHAKMLPEAKLATLRALQEKGERVGAVGDGINDAPLLAGADVGIVMDTGSALTRSGADVVLTGKSLRTLPEGVQLSRRALRTIRQNLGWAAGYNALALPLAALGIVPPWAAAIGMSLSSLLVVGNAMRLRSAPRQSASGNAVGRPLQEAS